MPRPTLLSLALSLGSWACGQSAPGFDPCRHPPQAPTLVRIHAGALLAFEPSDVPLELGQSADPAAAEPEGWSPGRALRLPETDLPREVRVFARARGLACPGPVPVFAFTYRVEAAYPPPAGEVGSTAVALDAARIRAWAERVVEVRFGPGVDESWRDTTRALGPAEGQPGQVVSLGEGGRITLEFARPLVDGPGPDLAVFENGLDDGFLELARVAVSSDGRIFARFDAASLAPGPVGPYDRMDTRHLGGLAGKYRLGFGTPFDLAELLARPEVADGRLDLTAVRFVRIEDVLGDGRALDSFGQPIHDPYPTAGSAGFDLDGVAALGEGP
jgi:hypothetical protein